MSLTNTFKPCFLIPVYNHKDVLAYILEKLEPYGLPCIMVNDGSDQACRDVMIALEAQHAWVKVYHLEQNGGKGAAVICGFRHALASGYSHCFQIDADGQHNLERIPEFLSAAERAPEALVTGYALYDESVPKSRLYGRYITHVWVWIETLSTAIKDSMCGFRIYPMPACLALISRVELGQRMEFDIEVVVRLHWMGVSMVNLPVEVSYPMDGISHFNVLQDNLRISKIHAMLFFTMLAHVPLQAMANKFRSMMSMRKKHE